MGKQTKVLSAIDENTLFTEDEIGNLIEYIFGHRKLVIQGVLEERGLVKSGTKQDLRQRVSIALKQSALTVESLIELLDQVEGWGNQHIFLYTSPPGEQRVWKSEARARRRLGDAGEMELFNKKRPLILPETPTLSTVEWSAENVRFI